MNFANKMILVPHDIVGENESVTKYLSNLDQEMLKIINDDTLPIDVKMLKYNQILRKYQMAKQDTQQPFKLEVQDTVMEPPPPEIQTKDAFEDTITQIIPQKWHKQALMLLKHARNNPHLKWSDRGEMIVDGRKIAGSNIVDLINDLARDRKTEPVIGSDVLLRKLLEENVPTEIVVNKKRLSMLKDDTYATPTKQPEEAPQLTPSPRKTRATSGFLSSWAGIAR